MAILIQNIQLLNNQFQWQTADLAIVDGKIAEIAPPGSLAFGSASDVWSGAGKTLLPGFIDLHIHGAMGYDIADANPQAFREIGRWLPTQGVTAWLASVTSLDSDGLQDVFNARPQDIPGAALMGFHMEGPWLNPLSAGAMDDGYFRLPDLAEFRRYKDVRLLTIAPEMLGALELISAVAADTVVTLGHTAADYSCALAAFRLGARSLTHVFNAMPPLLHRDPGVIGAAIMTGSFAELICDGIHVHQAAILAAWRIFGCEKLILISDAMRAAGLMDGPFELAGQAVEVREGIARTTAGRLAGSTSSLWRYVHRAADYGIPFTEAVRMASLTPATLIGEDHRRGSISVGKDADLILVDQSGQLEQTFIGGMPVLPACRS